MTNITKILQGKSDSIVLVMTLNKGKEQFHYLRVNSIKKHILTQIPIGSKTNLALYGSVIETGYGEPSERVRVMMKEQYGFEPDDY